MKSTDTRVEDKLHFVGLGGSGMMPLAILAARMGCDVTGSDRSFDRDPSDSRIAPLRAEGVTIVPQDGSGLTGRTMVISSAIEKSNPDYRDGMLHRSELLARFIDRPSILVAGSSGKTTTAAMIGWIFERAGRDPFVYLGGGVADLAPLGARFGSGPMIAEIDESDGSIARFRPDVAIVTSVTEDHKPIAEIEALFRDFIAKSRVAFVAEQAARLPGRVVRAGGARTRASGTRLLGAFNRINESLAVAVAEDAGIENAEELLGDFPGVARRLNIVRQSDDRIVVDDFAHNPEKIAASIDALREFDLPIMVIFQPHGFGPVKMHKAAYARIFTEMQNEDDRVILLPIFDAGGTADRTIRSEDIIEDAVRSRDEALEEAARFLESPGVVVVMGARDHSLSDYARRVAASLDAVIV